MASILGIIQDHLVRREPAPLISLLGPLMGVITGPYLDAEGVEREVRRGEQLACRIMAGASTWEPAEIGWAPTRVAGQNAEQRGALPALLANPSARRARECLLFLAEHPDSSNREVAVGIDVTHQSQISRLLRSMAGENLLVKRSGGAGKRNSWQLTPLGEEIVRTLIEHGGGRPCG